MHIFVYFWQVESEDKFERIGGSSIGGGTFWGLGALLTKTKVSLIKFCSCYFISFVVLPSWCISVTSSLLNYIYLSLVQRFDELLQLASKGQHSSVDMLVKDIYGGSYACLGLTGDLIASSFGKSATADKGNAQTNRYHVEIYFEHTSFPGWLQELLLFWIFSILILQN